MVWTCKQDERPETSQKALFSSKDGKSKDGKSKDGKSKDGKKEKEGPEKMYRQHKRRYQKDN